MWLLMFSRYLPMSLKEISQVKTPGQNQAIKIRIARMWDWYIPISQKFFGIAFLAADTKVFNIQFNIFKCYFNFFPPNQQTNYKNVFVRVMPFTSRLEKMIA